MIFRRSAGLQGRTKGAPLPLGSPREPTSTTIVIGGSIAAADLPRLCAAIEQDDADVVVCDVGALLTVDVGTIDALARLQLNARRRGSRVRLRGCSPELQALLAFAGLAETVPASGLPRLGRLRGQAEEREERVGVEESREADDPIP
jgi:ABC-type transporter Mla MlaB component